MRTLPTCSAVLSLFVVAAACGPKTQQTDPNAAPTATATYGQYPPGQYPQGQYPPGTYTQPTAQPGQYPAPTATAPAPAPAAGGQMAVPGPLAFQCQNDVPCGTHHCNMQYQKCAFPCQSAADCIPPNQCMAGLCVPAPPQQH